MAVGRGVAEEQAALVQVADQLLVGVLHERAAAGEVVCEHAVDVDGVDGLDAVRPAELRVLRAVGNGAVHDAGAVRGRYVVGGQYAVGVAALGEEVAVGGVVLDADEVRAGAARDLAPAVAEDARRQRLSDDSAFAVLVLRQDVGHVRADGQRAVRGERPGCGRPRDEGGPGRGPSSAVIAEGGERTGRRAVRHGLGLAHWEADVDAGVRRVFLVAERNLVRAEARDAARAVGRDLVALVDEALVPQALEHPPRRLDVRVLVGHVGVGHVEPDARALGHGLPLADVAEDALTAAAVELLDTELLDLLLTGDAELLLDLQLHGQAVGVPPAAAQGAEAAHGLVTQDDVLERAGEDVVDAGAAVRGGRALVEDEERRVRTGPFHLMEQVRVPP